MSAGSSTPPPGGSLKARLGLPVDSQLLERALTLGLRIRARRTADERAVEFLGDSVLGLVVTDCSVPPAPGPIRRQLAKLRAAVVKCALLPTSTERLDLGRYVRRPGAGGNGRPRQVSRSWATTVEALIGAVYSTAGSRPLDVCGTTSSTISSGFGDLGAGLDWKTSLQELSLRRCSACRVPVSETGPITPSCSPPPRWWGRVQGVGQGRARRRPSSGPRPRGALCGATRPAEQRHTCPSCRGRGRPSWLESFVVGRTVDTVEVRIRVLSAVIRQVLPTSSLPWPAPGSRRQPPRQVLWLPFASADKHCQKHRRRHHVRAARASGHERPAPRRSWLGSGRAASAGPHVLR